MQVKAVTSFSRRGKGFQCCHNSLKTAVGQAGFERSALNILRGALFLNGEGLQYGIEGVHPIYNKTWTLSTFLTQKGKVGDPKYHFIGIK